jgi:ribosome-associated translation inhibitor RaiA
MTDKEKSYFAELSMKVKTAEEENAEYYRQMQDFGKAYWKLEKRLEKLENRVKNQYWQVREGAEGV